MKREFDLQRKKMMNFVGDMHVEFDKQKVSILTEIRREFGGAGGNGF